MRTASVYWSKAEAHFAESLSQDPRLTPCGVVGSSYFAMFHAARAALTQETGLSPRTYAGIARRFEELATERRGPRQLAHENLTRVRALRMAADYGPPPVSVTDADEASARSSEFLSICAAEFGFPYPHAPHA
jgi:uncharacterized protein (UPF0332 family)